MSAETAFMCAPKVACSSCRAYADFIHTTLQRYQKATFKQNMLMLGNDDSTFAVGAHRITHGRVRLAAYFGPDKGSISYSLCSPSLEPKFEMLIVWAAMYVVHAEINTNRTDDPVLIGRFNRLYTEIERKKQSHTQAILLGRIAGRDKVVPAGSSAMIGAEEEDGSGNRDVANKATPPPRTIALSLKWS